MRYISRNRSRSVKAAPFTRATTLSRTTTAEELAIVFPLEAEATAVGAWDATWATVITAVKLTRTAVHNLKRILPRITRYGEGECNSPLPKNQPVRTAW